jgi:hypothetical protein
VEAADEETMESVRDEVLRLIRDTVLIRGDNLPSPPARGRSSFGKTEKNQPGSTPTPEKA